MNQNLLSFLGPHRALFVQQIKEWGEIILNWETRNKYEILDEQGNRLGFMAERSGGLWRVITRVFLRSHRPMEVDVWDANHELIMQMTRPFFWFFSDLKVMDGEGKVIGHVFRKFGILYKKYELCDAHENCFARIRSIFWRIWAFPIIDQQDREVAMISKKWGGFLKEIFTDADRFSVDFGNFQEEKKAVVFAAAISVDMDYFEDNHDGSNR